MTELLYDELFSKQSVYNKRKYTNIHYHNDFELYYLLNGRVKYFVANRSFLLNKGNLIIIPKKVLHSTDSENCLYNERLLLNFNEKHFHSDITPYIKSLCEENIVRIPEDRLALVEDMFYKIEAEYLKKRDGRDSLLKLYISELIIYLYRYKNQNASSDSQIDILIQNVADYITLNYNQELSLSLLSDHFSLSESYLSRRFKAAIGAGINEYINYIRITKAEALLKNSRIPITEVALKCGFNDSNYFSTVFKKMKGITPYKYSKQQNMQ